MNKIKYFILIAAFILNNTAYSNPSNNLQVDSTIQAFMTKWNIPGGSFSMMYNNILLYSKGYGYADTVSMELVTVTSLLRIASTTKPITAVAVMQLIQAGLINLNDKVFGLTGILNQQQYQTILDPRVLQITVEQLLEHTGGWDEDIQLDPMFLPIQIARWANIPSPPMQPTIIEYVLSQRMLDHNPGTYYAYCNFGYCLLGRIVEKVTGKTYGNYVRDSMLVKSGASSMQLAKSLLSGRYPREVRYYGFPGEDTTISVFDTTQVVPWPYGGFHIEATDSHGGWIASSLDLVKFLYAIHTDKLINQNTYNIMVTPSAVNPHYAKGWSVDGATISHVGSLPGSVSEFVKASNPYMWALIFNKRNNAIEFYYDLDSLGKKVQQFLPSPAETDSCPITGPVLVNRNKDIIYSTGIPTEHWHIENYGAAASIVDAVGGSVIIYSGSNIGSYTLYKTTADRSYSVLCSLNVFVEGPLPVEMQSFVSIINARHVLLKWVTSSEQNNSGFSIERLNTILNTWTASGFVSGNGNSNVSNNYEFIDKNLLTGTYKYRLKQIDYNGNYEYYNLSNDVIIGTPDKYSLSVNYPNPFNPVTVIGYSLIENRFTTLTIYDILGNEVQTLVNQKQNAGSYEVKFDGSGLSSGIYFYKMESGNFLMSRKMMLMK